MGVMGVVAILVWRERGNHDKGGRSKEDKGSRRKEVGWGGSETGRERERKSQRKVRRVPAGSKVVVFCGCIRGLPVSLLSINDNNSAQWQGL